MKSSVGSSVSLGTSARAIELMGLSQPEVQNLVDNPERRQCVVAAIRGELLLSTISKEQWIERELSVSERLNEYGLPLFDEALVKRGAELGAGLHDRFIPAGLIRRRLLETAGEAGIQLNGGNAKSADYEGEQIPTSACLFQLNYERIFRPFGEHSESNCPPFMMDYDQQWKLTSSVGGNGFSTAEMAIYISILRPFVENGNEMPFMGGAIRCRNAYGSASSLYVNWGADGGLDVFYCARSDRHWDLWALPEVSRELVS